MAKKPPPKGKLLRLKPKSKGKVIPLKPKAKPKAKVIHLKARKRGSATAAPALDEIDNEERLREAMEELAEARTELSRLGHAMTAAHRALEDQQLSAASMSDNLHAELDAVRTDLKTALAELEIARADRERIAGHAQKRIHDLEESLARLRAEVQELRAAPLPPPSAPTSGGREEEPA